MRLPLFHAKEIRSAKLAKAQAIAEFALRALRKLSALCVNLLLVLQKRNFEMKKGHNRSPFYLILLG